MIFELIFGLLLTFAGRDLFWLCVGIVGFLIGEQCASALGFPNDWVALLAAFTLGILGALLAISFEWFTVLFGVGFLGGGYLSMNIFSSVAGHELYLWPIFVVGGIVGTCLMVITFDWTLIIISSLLGATLIVNAYPVTGALQEFLYIGSLVAGIIVQFLKLRGSAVQKSAVSR